MNAHPVIPPEVPERLRSLAKRLSWEDCVNLLCMYEGWSQTHRTADIRSRSGKLADDMRLLVNALPYEWDVPPPTELGPVTAIAETLRTGVMPKSQLLKLKSNNPSEQDNHGATQNK